MVTHSFTNLASFSSRPPVLFKYSLLSSFCSVVSSTLLDIAQFGEVCTSEHNLEQLMHVILKFSMFCVNFCLRNGHANDSPSTIASVGLAQAHPSDLHLTSFWCITTLTINSPQLLQVCWPQQMSYINHCLLCQHCQSHRSHPSDVALNIQIIQVTLVDILIGEQTIWCHWEGR